MRIAAPQSVARRDPPRSRAASLQQLKQRSITGERHATADAPERAMSAISRALRAVDADQRAWPCLGVAARASRASGRSSANSRSRHPQHCAELGANVSRPEEPSRRPAITTDPRASNAAARQIRTRSLWTGELDQSGSLIGPPHSTTQSRYPRGTKFRVTLPLVVHASRGRPALIVEHEDAGPARFSLDIRQASLEVGTRMRTSAIEYDLSGLAIGERGGGGG